MLKTMLKIEELNQKYRMEKSNRFLTSSLEEDFYSKVQREVIDPMERELHNCIDNGEEVHEDLNKTLIKARARCQDIKQLRATKIVNELVTYARFKKGFRGENSLDGTKLLSDERGDEIKLQEAVLKALNEFFDSSTK